MPTCVSCRSAQTQFVAEIAIHFPGSAGLNKPPVLAHPKLMICLKCGHVEFALTDEQLKQLQEGDFPAQRRKGASGQ
jgi:hypothetical protein